MLVKICNSTVTADKPATRAHVVYRENGTILADLWKAGEWWEFTNPSLVSELFCIRHENGYAGTAESPIWGVLQKFDPNAIAKPSVNPIPPSVSVKFKVTVTAVFKPTGQTLYDRKEVEVAGVDDDHAILMAKKQLGVNNQFIEITFVKAERVPEAA